MTLDRVQFSGGIPHEAFSLLRNQKSPTFSSLGGSDPSWHIVSHRDVLSCLRSPEIFSSHSGGTTLQDQTPEQIMHNTSLLHTDPPEHTRLRSAFNQALSRTAVEQSAPQLDRIAEQLVAECVRAGSVDVPQVLCARMASYSLCHFLQIPDRLRDHFVRLSALMLADTTPNPTASGSPQGGPNFANESHFFTGSPSMAMVDLLMTYCYDSDRSDSFGRRQAETAQVTEREVEDVLVILATAGTGMTMNAIATMLWQLAVGWDTMVTRDGELAVNEERFIEESLRFATPLMHSRRTVSAPAAVSGQALEAGDKVVLWLASANFDEQVFDAPEEFRPNRSPNPHLSFARSSPHVCLGAHLARLEMKSVLRAVLRASTHLETISTPEYLPSNFVNEIVRLPITFTPRIWALK
jgi:cytochrome P450